MRHDKYVFTARVLRSVTFVAVVSVEFLTHFRRLIFFVPKMRNKLLSAPVLFSFLSVLLASWTASEDLPGRFEEWRFQESSDELHFTSKTLKASNVLHHALPKGLTDDASSVTKEHHNYEDNDVGTNQTRNLTQDVCQQLKLSDESAWRINQTGLDLLDNDPQKLINCTESGDTVLFELAGYQKFKRTLVVHHKLEFISRSPATNRSEDESKNVAIFTCPESGPFLAIQSTNFMASGFLVKNCTNPTTNGTVIIFSRSEVKFDNITFRNNSVRAINASSEVKLTLNSCRFEKNSLSIGNGAAIYFLNNCSVTIVHSNFSNNTLSDGDGGGVYGDTNNTLSIKHSIFSGNNATRKGGAACLSERNNVTVEESSFIMNKADVGGALRFYGDNNVTIKASNLSNNRALRSAAALAFNRNNNVTIELTNFSKNIAPGAAVMLFSIQNNVTLISSSLKGNNGTKYGGALSVNVFSTATIRNTSFVGNKARWGGALYAECDADVSLSNCSFLNNTARKGGAIGVWTDCHILIRNSTFQQNNATNGGCLYVDSSKIEVDASNFTENNSTKLGGCFSTDSSSITIINSDLSKNKAVEGGGIHASTRSFLNMTETTISSNQANDSAGGLALVYDSKLLCCLCKFKYNTAERGGGMYIQSHTKQIVVAQIQESIFDSNEASLYGGGMVVETLGTKALNCTDDLATCSKVLLFKMDFTNNSATISGSAILATTPNNVLFSCYKMINHTSPVFVSEDILEVLQTKKVKQINPNDTCLSWQNNSPSSNGPGDAIGTFGHHLVLTLASKVGPQIDGDYKPGYVLSNVKSAKQFPNITVETKDAFGKMPAPVLFKKDALQLVASKKFLKNNISFSFENRSCIISSIHASAPNGTYMIKIIPKREDVLEPTTLNVSISDCGINEELTKDTRVCQECRNGSYNFNASKQDHCMECPKHAKCDGIFLLVKEGYWQRSPCHYRVKKCIVKRACNHPNRTKNIASFTQNYTDCDFIKTNLEDYGKIQCRKGYKGPLCGSCKKSYGLSAQLECSKCGRAIVIALRCLGAVVYLLGGTIIIIKGVLPSPSHPQKCEDVETPLLEPGSSTTTDVASSSQVREELENGNQDSSRPMVEGDTSLLSSTSHGDEEIEITKQTLVSSLKISLNYFQVTSNAAGMDVEWTHRLLDMLKGLNILGAATTESISYSFDCMFSSSSNESKAVWRLLFSLFVPMLVIALLSLHWGYRSWKRHGSDGVYFFRRMVLTLITVTYATYFELTQAAMHTFSCVVVHANDDPFSKATTMYWTGDTSLQCYKNTHIVLVCISFVIVMLVTIGFPTFSSFTLDQHKSEVRDTSTWTHDTLGFLGGPFKQRFIYWDCVIMIKKAILSIIIVFSYSLEAQAEGLLILLVLVCSLYTHFLCYPYDEKYHTLNYYESGSLLVSCVTYTLIQFFNVERFSAMARSIISLSVIAINGGFICLMAYKILKDLARLLRALLKSQNIHIPKNMNVFSLIKIYYKRRSPQDAL